MEKQNSLFGDVPKEQREKLLSEMATNRTSERVRRPYTEEEKATMKDLLATEGIQLMDAKEEFAEIRKEFNATMKDANAKLDEALKSLKRGYSDDEEPVYMLDDQEAGQMHVYDKYGVFLYSRNLYPEEKQYKLKVANGASE